MNEDDEAEDPPKTAALTGRQKAKSALPAVYIDTWSLIWWEDHIRLTLAEWLYKQPAYRFAAVMEFDDAERLGKHLLDLVARARKEIRDREENQDLPDDEAPSAGS